MYKRLRIVSFGLFTALMLACLLTACANGGVIPPTDANGAEGMPTSGGSGTPTHQGHGPLTSIRMVDSTHGWALTGDSVLKTTDGGQHWQDVTPSDAPANAYSLARGAFPNAQVAWVASVQEQASTVTVEHTTDGGAHWQKSTISAPDAASVDMPHFLNEHEGWLEVIGHPGAGNQGATIYHSNDAGVHWQQISASGSGGIANSGFKSGISFLNSQTGYATTRSTTGLPTDPGLYVTRDGGKTWQKQPLSFPRGMENIVQIGTTPPVFVGNSGFLPVYITTQDNHHFLNLYYTEDGGTHWMPRGNADLDARTVFVLDSSHAWASDGQNGKLYRTQDGGVSWNATDQAPGIFHEMSFVDANNGWAITDSALLHTSDGGTSWETINYRI